MVPHDPNKILATDLTRVEEFSDLLKKIEYASRETKKLWHEIYENANDDRTRASLLFADLYQMVANSSDGHTMHGKQIAQYLERMNKSNDQLLKLAELVEAASGGSNDIDAEALYNEINKK